MDNAITLSFEDMRPSLVADLIEALKRDAQRSNTEGDWADEIAALEARME